MASDSGANCEAMNARGERCRKRAVRGRFCLVHAGEQDMRLLGKKGGSRSPLTKLRKAADDSLREQARAVLARALAGEQVDKEQLAAARSLFSYRSDVPPVGEQAREQTGGKVVVLGDLIRVAVECGLVRAADGGAILVGDEIIKNADPSLPSREESRSRETWDPLDCGVIRGRADGSIEVSGHVLRAETRLAVRENPANEPH